LPPIFLHLEKQQICGKILPLEYSRKGFMERGQNRQMDYYILFRDLDDPTPIDYVKRRWQEDLLIADKTSYAWGYIGELNDSQIRAVRARLVWENSKRHYEEGNSLGASGLTKYAFEFEISAIEPETLDFLAKLSPNLAFLSSVSPNYRFLFYPESDEESLRINQALSSLPEQNNCGFSWSMHELDFPKIHSSSAQLLPLDLLVDGWKRVGYSPHMEILRHTAAIQDIEATISPSVPQKKTWKNMWKKPEKTFSLFSTNLKSVSPAEAQKIFKSIVLDKEKYISTLTPRQLKVLGECVDIANSIRTADGHGDKNIENIYAATRINVAGRSASPSLTQTASGQDMAPIIPVVKFTEQVPTDDLGGTPHVFSAPSGNFTPDIIIDGNTVEIGDTTGNPLHTSESPDSPLIEILKEQTEILRERLPLPTTIETETTPANFKKSELTVTPAGQTLKPPKPKINLETVIAGIYETRPETKTWGSVRLLAYLKDWAREQGVTIDVTDSRIRQLKIWEANRIHRESGKTRFGYNSDDFAEDEADETDNEL